MRWPVRSVEAFCRVCDHAVGKAGREGGRRKKGGHICLDCSCSTPTPRAMAAVVNAKNAIESEAFAAASEGGTVEIAFIDENATPNLHLRIGEGFHGRGNLSLLVGRANARCHCLHRHNRHVHPSALRLHVREGVRGRCSPLIIVGPSYIHFNGDNIHVDSSGERADYCSRLG